MAIVTKADVRALLRNRRVLDPSPVLVLQTDTGARLHLTHMEAKHEVIGGVMITHNYTKQFRMLRKHLEDWHKRTPLKRVDRKGKALTSQLLAFYHG